MSRAKKNFVVYYRVSTQKQNGEMATQKTAVKNYLKKYWPPVASFTEVESGAKSASARPELNKALEYCQKHKATLIVSKLDRLSRDLEFIAKMQKSEIPFVCADCPTASKESLAIMGVFAQYEREMIARRTKEALAELKKKGVLLGANNVRVRAGLERWRKKQALQTAKRKAQKKAEIEKAKSLKAQGKAPAGVKPSKREVADQKFLPTIKALRGQGLSFEGTARAMNKAGIKTRNGSPWSDTQVFRVCKRNGV